MAGGGRSVDEAHSILFGTAAGGVHELKSFVQRASEGRGASGRLQLTAATSWYHTN